MGRSTPHKPSYHSRLYNFFDAARKTGMLSGDSYDSRPYRGALDGADGGEPATYSVSYAKVDPGDVPLTVTVREDPVPLTVPIRVGRLTVPACTGLVRPCPVSDFLTHFAGGEEKGLWVGGDSQTATLNFGDFSDFRHIVLSDEPLAFQFIRKAIGDGAPVSVQFRKYLDYLCVWSFLQTYEKVGGKYIRTLPVFSLKTIQPGSVAMQGLYDLLLVGGKHPLTLAEQWGGPKLDLFFDALLCWHSDPIPVLKPLLLVADGDISSIFMQFSPPSRHCAYHCSSVRTLSKATICSLSLRHGHSISDDSTTLATVHVLEGEFRDATLIFAGNNLSDAVSICSGAPTQRFVYDTYREFVMCRGECTLNLKVASPEGPLYYDREWVFVRNGIPVHACRVQRSRSTSALLGFSEGKFFLAGYEVAMRDKRKLSYEETDRVRDYVTLRHAPPLLFDEYLLLAPWDTPVHVGGAIVIADGRIWDVPLCFYARGIGPTMSLDFVGPRYPFLSMKRGDRQTVYDDWNEIVFPENFDHDPFPVVATEFAKTGFYFADYLTSFGDGYNDGLNRTVPKVAFQSLFNQLWHDRVAPPCVIRLGHAGCPPDVASRHLASDLVRVQDNRVP